MCEEPRGDAAEVSLGSTSAARCVAAVVLSAMLVLGLSSCAAPHAVVHEKRPTAMSPEHAPMTDIPHDESYPIPPPCRVATSHSLGEDDGPPRVCEELPPLSLPSPVSIDTERLATVEQKLQQLTETILRHDQQISTIDTVGAQTQVALGEQTVEIQRALAKIRQANAEGSHRLNVISQKLTELEAAQQANREEQDRVLDEIISGLEQALALDANSPD